MTEQSYILHITIHYIMEKISHNGSLSTSTDFKLKDGSQIRIEVWFTISCSASNRNTFYKFNVFTKKKYGRKWYFKFASKTPKDDRIFKIISEQQLYTAFYNHWYKLNPIRIFSKGSYNSELTNFSVEEKQAEKHYNY